MKRFKRGLCLVLSLVMVLSMSVTAFASTENTMDKAKVSSNNLIEEDRTGKTVTFFVNPNGKVIVIEDNQNNFTSSRPAGELEHTYALSASTDVLVGTHTLSAAQTAQIKQNIQGITQATNLIAVLTPFLPQPFAGVFLAVTRVSIFAEDARWAGTYGKSIVMEEWCRLPHTSYSHYFTYTIVD